MLRPRPARSRSKGLNDKVDTLTVEIDAIKAKALTLESNIIESIDSCSDNYDSQIDRLRDDFHSATRCMETENQELRERVIELSDKVGFLMRVVGNMPPPASSAPPLR